MRIDGVLRKILTIPKNLQNSVISRLKIMSGMDIAERVFHRMDDSMLRIRSVSLTFV